MDEGYHGFAAFPAETAGQCRLAAQLAEHCLAMSPA